MATPLGRPAQDRQFGDGSNVQRFGASAYRRFAKSLHRRDIPLEAQKLMHWAGRIGRLPFDTRPTDVTFTEIRSRDAPRARNRCRYRQVS